MLYRKVREADEIIRSRKAVERSKLLDEWTLNTTLENLDSFAVYSISVLAFTVKGDGPRSKPVYGGMRQF